MYILSSEQLDDFGFDWVVNHRKGVTNSIQKTVHWLLTPDAETRCEDFNKYDRQCRPTFSIIKNLDIHEDAHEHQKILEQFDIQRGRMLPEQLMKLAALHDGCDLCKQRAMSLIDKYHEQEKLKELALQKKG